MTESPSAGRPAGRRGIERAPSPGKPAGGGRPTIVPALRASVAAAVLAAAALALGAAPLGAQPPVGEIDRVLLDAVSPADLRARLILHAQRVEKTDPSSAGRSLYWVGVSHERAGHRDSAIILYGRAVELSGDHESRLALADALLSRRSPEDVASARDCLERGQASRTLSTEALQTGYQARLAWSQVLSGHSDSAVVTFAPLERRLSRESVWRFRMARAHHETGDFRKALNLLLPLAVQSRGQDADVMRVLENIGTRTGAKKNLDGELERLIGERDRIERAALDRIKARGVRFGADDGFPLGGVLMAPEGRGRTRGAVVYLAPGDTIADYDSLGVALNRAGYSVLFLDVRGSGWSVAAACPLPDTWTGREEALHTLCARDVRPALRVLAQEARVDTSGFLIAGVGPTSSIAVQAAELDPRASALLLVSPLPAPVERGPMRARIARLQLPIYFQVGPEDFLNGPVTEAFYQAGERGASRVAEARLVGHGPRQFYYDPAISTRFIRWLDETRKRAPRRSPPPGSRSSR